MSFRYLRISIPRLSATIPSCTSVSQLPSQRAFSVSSAQCQSQPPSQSPASSSPAPSPSRWLSDIKSRLGACMTFGCNEGEEMELAGRIAGTLAREWRGLLAGADGFWIEELGGEKESGREGLRAGKENRGNAWVEGVRWGDMDSMVSAIEAGMLEPECHVNNVSYLRYAEISRIYYFRRLARFIPQTQPASTSTSESLSALHDQWMQLWTPKHIGLIYSKASVSFLFPVKYPDRLTLCHRLADNLPSPGESMKMIPLEVVALSHGKQRNSVRVYEENVVYDYRAEKRIEMPEWMVEVLRHAKGEEDRMKREWAGRRRVVERWVDKLEGRTIKSGRAEDMG